MEFTFVGEDDVVKFRSQLSLSLRECCPESDYKSAPDVSISAEMPFADGYQFVHLESF